MSGTTVVKGVMFMSSANVSFCIMACMVKYVSYLNVYTTTLFRFLVGIGILGLLALGGWIDLRFINKSGLFIRGVMGGTAIAISFLSIVKLGLIKAGVIIQLYPLFAALFGWVLLREKMKRWTTVSIAAAFLGVCLLITDRSGSDFSAVGWYEAIAVFGALVGGLTVVLVKKLQATDSTPAIFFAQCLVGFWIVLIPATVDSQPVTVNASLILVAIGIFATIGQLLSTDSYRYLSIATGSVLVMGMPVFTGLAGAFLFHERLHLQGYAGAGIVLIATTVALCTAGEKKRKGKT
ncbi:MAG: DMT family transporter [Chitinispirillaceae bacterium]|nr:DMT family transporter [Chitinispirillaceae bacterium]